MTWRCPADDSEVFTDGVRVCPNHVRSLVFAPATLSAAQVTPERVGVPAQDGVARRETWSKEVCWRCGTPSPHPDNKACLRLDCRRSLVPPALHIRFQDGEVELRAGERAELGRRGSYERLFRGFPNVSRRHAVVGVDGDGRVWIEPLLTPNGTFINGAEIPESIGKTLFSGDSIRFARNAEGAVTIYDGQPHTLMGSPP